MSALLLKHLASDIVLDQPSRWLSHAWAQKRLEDLCSVSLVLLCSAPDALRIGTYLQQWVR